MTEDDKLRDLLQAAPPTSPDSSGWPAQARRRSARNRAALAGAGVAAVAVVAVAVTMALTPGARPVVAVPVATTAAAPVTSACGFHAVPWLIGVELRGFVSGWTCWSKGASVLEAPLTPEDLRVIEADLAVNARTAPTDDSRPDATLHLTNNRGRTIVLHRVGAAWFAGPPGPEQVRWRPGPDALVVLTRLQGSATPIPTAAHPPAPVADRCAQLSTTPKRLLPDAQQMVLCALPDVVWAPPPTDVLTADRTAQVLKVFTSLPRHDGRPRCIDRTGDPSYYLVLDDGLGHLAQLEIQWPSCGLVGAAGDYRVGADKVMRAFLDAAKEQRADQTDPDAIPRPGSWCGPGVSPRRSLLPIDLGSLVNAKACRYNGMQEGPSTETLLTPEDAGVLASDLADPRRWHDLNPGCSPPNGRGWLQKKVAFSNLRGDVVDVAQHACGSWVAYLDDPRADATSMLREWRPSEEAQRVLDRVLK